MRKTGPVVKLVLFLLLLVVPFLVGQWTGFRTADPVPKAEAPPQAGPGAPGPDVAATSEASTPTPDPVETGEAGTEIVIRLRDLADGAGVSGLVLTSSSGDPGGRVVEHTTGAGGALRLLESELANLTVADPGWRLPSQSPEEITSVGEIWCYRQLTIDGQVDVGSERAEPPEFTIEALLVSRMGQITSPAEAPWNAQWLRSHGVRVARHVGRSEPDGHFLVSVPRIRGLALRAANDGGLSGSAAVEMDSLMEATWVRIPVEQPVVVTGRLLDSNGSPCVGIRVRVMAEEVLGYEESESLDLSNRMGKYAVTMARSRSSDVARVTTTSSARTDEDGSFRIEMPGSGRGMLVTWKEERAPLRRELGELVAGDLDLGDLNLTPPESSGSIQVVRGGRPLPGHQVLLVDLSSSVGQPSPPPIRLDEQGRMPSSWLETGREYYLHVTGPGVGRDGLRGWLEWNGQGTIDVLSDLRPMKRILAR